MSQQPKARRHSRIEAYLGARCTILVPGLPPACITGRTRDVSPGGAMLLLPTCIPPFTTLMIRLDGEPQIRSQVVWAGKLLSTDLGKVMVHGIAFTRDLDAATLNRMLTGMRMRRHPRVPTHFPIEHSDMEESGTGTCLNLSQGGMFIATSAPPPAGQDVMIHVAPPGLLHPFSLWSRIVWTNDMQNPSGFPAGIGVRFVKVEPMEAKELSALLQKIQSGTAATDQRVPSAGLHIG